MLVVRARRAVCRALVYKVSEVEKTKEEVCEKLKRENISRQGWTEKKEVANLVPDEIALGPLLEFLKATKVGGREGAGERELELEQRNDQAGKDLLND